VERFTDLRGTVEVAEGARITAADSVLLLGRHVASYGNITARDGTIALVAGDAVRLARVGSRVVVNADPAVAPDPERFAVTQAGTADAGRGAVHLTAADGYSLAMNHTGITRAREIHAEGGEDGLVDVAGTLDATGEDPGDTGGTIHVLGERIALRDATLDASGDAGGGAIRVGGDLQGKGALRTAQRTWVSEDAVLRADALGEGDGGTIIVWADDATRFHGTLSARGGARGGDGGFAEISGRRSLVARGDVDLGAPHGASGTLLYDPYAIEITGSAGGDADGSDLDADDPDEDPAVFLRGDDGTLGEVAADDGGDGATPFVIHESELEGTDANIVLQARRRVTTDGEFLDDNVVIAGGNDLTIEVTGEEDEGDPVEPTSFFGIDLQDPDGGVLVWRLSDGGRLTLSTTSTSEQLEAGAEPAIRVDAVETRGVRDGELGLDAVSIAAEGAGGDIAVGTIDTRGTPNVPGLREIDEEVSIDDERGGGVSLTTLAGDITVSGLITTRGADARAPTSEEEDAEIETRGDGGAGGLVRIETLAGDITVGGEIDVSGGAGFVDETFTEGRAGQAGGIAIASSGGPGGGAPTVALQGNLTAVGGAGRGTALVAETPTAEERTRGSAGGAGGGILVIADAAGGTGTIALSPGIRLDSSGGDGTAGGGGASAGIGITLLSGEVLDRTSAITLESGADLVTNDVRFHARGGDAGVEDGMAIVGIDADPVVGDVRTGGLGGNGGDVALVSTAGSVTLGALASGDAAIVTDGGEGRIDAVFSQGAGRLDGQGGSAGTVTLRAESAAGDVDAVAPIQALGGRGDQGRGGSGGSVRLETAGGSVALGRVDTSGGEGRGTVMGAEPLGARGGAGGNVEVGPAFGLTEAEVASITLRGDLETLGGEGVATPPPDGEDSAPDAVARANYGLAGVVALETAGQVTTSGDGAAVRVRARSVVVDAGSIVPDASGSLTFASADGWGPADAEDTVAVTVDGDAFFTLSTQGPDSDGDDSELFDRVSLTQADPTGSVGVTGGQGGAFLVQAGEGTDATRHRIGVLRTGDADPFLTYRLLDGTLVVDPDEGSGFTEPVQIGLAGAKLANARLEGGRDVLRGDIVGAGAGPHLVTRGNLELVAENVGAGAPLHVQGAAGADVGVELTVAGDVDLVADGDGLGRVDVQKRETQGRVFVNLAGTDEVEIEGVTETDGNTGDGVGGIEIDDALEVRRLDTSTSGVAFFLSLEDDDDGRGGQPTVVVQADAVALGAEAGLAGTGDVLLENGTGAVQAGGHTLALFADADFDGTGAIRATDPTARAIDGAGALVLLSGEGVGEVADAEAGTPDAPLIVRGDGGAGVTVAGSGGSGDFHLVNETGELRLEPIALEELLDDGEDGRATFAGLHADGDVVLDNGDRTIVLGAIQPDEEIERFTDGRGLGLQGEDTDGGGLRIGFGGIAVEQARLQGTGNTTAPHVTSGGSQTYAGNVVLDNQRSSTVATTDPDTGDEVEETTELHEVLLEAGGDVTFTGDVDTSAGSTIDASLEVDAEGTTVFRGNVGSTARLGDLATNAARFDDGVAGNEDSVTHAVRVASADFRGTVDGPDALAIDATTPDEGEVPEGEEAVDSRVTFRGDVGAGAALERLTVDAEAIRFASTGAGRADRVVTRDGIFLNTLDDSDVGNAPDETDVPAVATIADTGGGLSLETGGDIEVGRPDGRPEKLSVLGALALHAGADGTVTVGDLSADRIRVVASRIEVRRRSAADVRLPDGSTRRDRGVDWVANDIRTSVAPVAVGSGARPTFVLGSGGIDVAGPLPFDVIRFRGGGGEVDAASFAGPDGEPLDLSGAGARVLADPTDDLPRPAPPVAPGVAPRFGESAPAPAPAPRVSGEQVLAYLACRAPEDGVCDAETARERLDLPAFARTALATERARGIAAESWELVRGPDARAQLVAAFAPVERAWRRIAGPGPVQGEALYRLLAAEPGLAEARGRVDRLAALLAQVSLLGLPTEDTGRVQGALAADFAAATGMAGLDARAVLTAAGTSPVGQIPDTRAR